MHPMAVRLRDDAMTVAVGTIASRQLMPVARVLATSFRVHHPDVPFFVVAAYPDPDIDERAPFTIIPIDAIGLPPLETYAFQYKYPNVIFSAKAWLLSHLLDRGFSRAVFLDSDILILGDLGGVLSPGSDPDIWLTPHLLDPANAARELVILQSGVFNGGMVGVANRPQARQFLAWWQRRLQRHCRYELADGLHNDQRWLDFVPAFFDRFEIIRDPGANVAYWNLHERHVEIDGDEVRVNGQSARFFHFSGFDPATPHVVTRYQPSLTPADMGPAAELFGRYASLATREGWRSADPEPWSTFDNGAPVYPVMRRIFLEVNGVSDRFSHPFATAGADSFYCWLQQPVDQSAAARPQVTNFWHCVYKLRTDLQKVYPDVFGADRVGFMIWAHDYGVHELAMARGPA